MSLRVSSGEEAVSIATQWIGTPYQWGGGHGGAVPVGTPVDCSGLVDQVFGVTGTTFTQVKMGASVNGLSNAGPGDLVFFGPLAPGEPHHVGIYTGTGMMIDAPHTGTNVRRDTVAGFGPIYDIRRLVPTSASDTSSVSNAGSLIYNYAQLEGVWIQAGGNAQAAPMAAAIAMAESNGDANASGTNSNNSIDRGLWQINSVNGAQSSFDVMTNARAAISISNNGQTWRPWCTAYSDGACGTKGGSYLGSGAPYQQFLQYGVTPDMTAPVNATNAQTATLTGISLFPQQQSDPANVVNNAIKSTISAILNPLIQVIAGSMGIAAGGVLMFFGMYMIISSTREFQKTSQGIQTGVKLGAKVVAPESRLAGTRTATYERQLPSGQTKITTVRGKSGWRRYQQKSSTAIYGLTDDQRAKMAQNIPPSTRDILRAQAGGYTDKGRLIV